MCTGDETQFPQKLFVVFAIHFLTPVLLIHLFIHVLAGVNITL
ncbi:putative membrane protein [Escherichia coli 2-005-03_S4_C2]|nr:putative membrane protein [Escherichia coli 2-005-03_S4_C3]EZJ53471.1 putative membrane protein [Escherichia coli 2-005-03_S4_C2]KDT29307.1 putative membrane protein [Escherichia coli 2-052-05_S4_C1]